MSEIDNPPPDLDYEGDAMDSFIEASKAVVGFRRKGDTIHFGITPGAVVVLTADEAEFIARQLFAASVSARLTAAARAVEDWCRANPSTHEPVTPAPGFGPAPERVTVSYLRADRDITLIETLTASKHTAREVRSTALLPFIHVYEECPSVKAALRRDGEVLRSRAPVDAFLNPPAAQPCGWCLRRWNA